MWLAEISLRQERSEILEGKEFGKRAFWLDQREAIKVSKQTTVDRIGIKCFNFCLRDHR